LGVAARCSKPSNTPSALTSSMVSAPQSSSIPASPSMVARTAIVTSRIVRVAGSTASCTS
jgi:hypothetical protein